MKKSAIIALLNKFKNYDNWAVTGSFGIYLHTIDLRQDEYNDLDVLVSFSDLGFFENILQNYGFKEVFVESLGDSYAGQNIIRYKKENFLIDLIEKPDNIKITVIDDIPVVDLTCILFWKIIFSVKDSKHIEDMESICEHSGLPSIKNQLLLLRQADNLYDCIKRVRSRSNDNSVTEYKESLPF
jgi:hypothetical protein